MIGSKQAGIQAKATPGFPEDIIHTGIPVQGKSASWTGAGKAHGKGAWMDNEGLYILLRDFFDGLAISFWRIFKIQNIQKQIFKPLVR